MSVLRFFSFSSFFHHWDPLSAIPTPLSCWSAEGFPCFTCTECIDTGASGSAWAGDKTSPRGARKVYRKDHSGKYETRLLGETRDPAACTSRCAHRLSGTWEPQSDGWAFFSSTGSVEKLEAGQTQTQAYFAALSLVSLIVGNEFCPPLRVAHVRRRPWHWQRKSSRMGYFLPDSLLNGWVQGEAEAGMWNTAQGLISASSVLHKWGKSTFDLWEHGLALCLFRVPASPKKIQLFSDAGGVVAVLYQRHKPGSFVFLSTSCFQPSYS